MKTELTSVGGADRVVGELAATREEVGYTQAELAARVRATRQTISRWERDPGRMTLAGLVDYANAVGAKVEVTVS